MTNENQTRQSYNLSAEAFAKNVQDLDPGKRANKFVEMLPQKAAILDAGCGSGRDAKVFSACGLKVIGIDFSEKMLEIAKKTAPEAEFCLMDLVSISFPKSSFEGIWANASLLHIAKDKIPSVLKSFYSILKPKGILYVRVKKGEGEGVIKDQRYSGIEKFFAFFQETEIASLITECGFVIDSLATQEKSHSYDTHQFIDIFAKKPD